MDGNNVEDVYNGQSAAKRLSNGERQETVRVGMGALRSALSNIQSGPCESSAEREEGKAEMPCWRAAWEHHLKGVLGLVIHRDEQTVP